MSEPPLSSAVLTSPADALLREAIDTALRAEPQARVELFARLLHDIEEFMRAHPEERPWTFESYVGTDGSRIFRGGLGRSVVIDPAGTIWRARNYEDFDTTYTITASSCTIASLTPRYEEMRQYPID